MSAHTPITEPIATGDRRGEVHFEPDADQLVVASHLVRPPQLEPHGDLSAEAAQRDAPPVEDVKVAPEAPSVWDARPVDR